MNSKQTKTGRPLMYLWNTKKNQLTLSGKLVSYSIIGIFSTFGNILKITNMLI